MEAPMAKTTEGRLEAITRELARQNREWATAMKALSEVGDTVLAVPVDQDGPDHLIPSTLDCGHPRLTFSKGAFQCPTYLEARPVRSVRRGNRCDDGHALAGPERVPDSRRSFHLLSDSPAIHRRSNPIGDGG